MGARRVEVLHSNRIKGRRNECSLGNDFSVSNSCHAQEKQLHVYHRSQQIAPYASTMKHLVNIPTEYRNQTYLPRNDAPFVERQGENRLQQALDVTDTYALDLEEVMFVMTSYVSFEKHLQIVNRP
ncbi:hypothetical protein ACHAWT_011211 [Skeletonema menzelii]